MKKIVQGFIALILAGILAAGVCCMGYASRDDGGKWFGNFKNISEWHWADSEREPDDNPDTADSKNLLMTISNNSSALSLAADNATSDSKSVTVTATVEPESAENKEVYFTLAFEDPNSSLLNGNALPHYMTMTTNSNAATVTCLNAFPVQIVLTATAVGNSNLVSTCTFDYIPGVTGADFAPDGYNTLEPFKNVYSNGDGDINFYPTFGTGTIASANFKAVGAYFELSSRFIDEIGENSYYGKLMRDYASVYAIDMTNKIFLDKHYPGSDKNNIYFVSAAQCWNIRTFNDPTTFFMSDTETPELTSGSDTYNYALAAFKQTARKTTDNMRFCITWTAEYTFPATNETKTLGGTYCSDWFTINADDIEANLLDGNSVNLDKNNVIFGDI